ncbi:MAG TPA: GNAT family protein [Gaiellaceae bacterium]|jgi:RimJ/RimL family protein N-acetyltransferase
MRGGRSGSPTPPGTERLTFEPLDSPELAAHWRQHGFGDWKLLYEGRFAGLAEIHYAWPGVTGLETDEVEVGWEIVEELRGRGLATEAMRAAIADAWQRTGVDHLVAYIQPENTASLRVADKLGFCFRNNGLTRSGDPMLVFEVRPDPA